MNQLCGICHREFKWDAMLRRFAVDCHCRQILAELSPKKTSKETVLVNLPGDNRLAIVVDHDGKTVTSIWQEPKACVNYGSGPVIDGAQLYAALSNIEVSS